MRGERKTLTFGVGGRLLVAFLAICLFSLVGAVSGFITLSQVGRSLSKITEKQVPEALSWLELSRQAERVVRAAPALLAVTTEDERVQVSAEIAAQAEQLNRLLQQIGNYAAGDNARTGPEVQTLVGNFNQNLMDLEDLVKRRIFIASRKESLISQLSQANMVAQRLISSAARVLDAHMAEWDRASGTAASNSLSAEQSAVARSIISLIPQQYAGALIDSVNNALLKIATAESSTEIDVMLFPLQKKLESLSNVSQGVPDNIKRRLAAQIGLFQALATGPNSLTQIRKDELGIVAQIRDLLTVNSRLSGDLTKEVNRLVAEANIDIATSRSQASSVEVANRNVLLIVVVLSLMSSVLIVWLYVGRNLIRRLTALSNSMLAIAGGDLRAPLPTPGGSDEIGRMAEALSVRPGTLRVG